MDSQTFGQLKLSKHFLHHLYHPTPRMRVPSTQLLRLLRANEHSPPKCVAPQRSLTPRNVVSFCLHKSYDQYPRRAHTSSAAALRQSASVGRSSDRGPISNEDTQTDFGSLNVLGNAPPPTTSIDACLIDGFHLDNGLKIGNGSGCLLIAGEAFSWRPWEASGKVGVLDRGGMINTKGQWAVEKGAWGILDLVWPKPGMASSIHSVCRVVPRYSRNNSLYSNSPYIRSPYSRPGCFYLSNITGDEKIYQLVGHTGGNTGHEECCCSIQFTGHGKRRQLCGRRPDPNRMERKMTI